MLRWCQSPRAKLVVGEDASSGEKSFLIPEEFLRRRSQDLREQLARGEKTIVLRSTTIQTVTEFFIWNHSPNPKVADRLTFDEVVQLAILAFNYKIPSLSNQATDRIRA